MIDLYRLAREAGISTAEYRIWPPKFSKVYTLDAQQMTAFAQLVAEEAAKLCAVTGALAAQMYGDGSECVASADLCADAIRSAFGIEGPKDDPDAI